MFKHEMVVFTSLDILLHKMALSSFFESDNVMSLSSSGSLTVKPIYTFVISLDGVLLSVLILSVGALGVKGSSVVTGARLVLLVIFVLFKTFLCVPD